MKTGRVSETDGPEKIPKIMGKAKSILRFRTYPKRRRFYRYLFALQGNLKNWRYYKVATNMPVVRSALEEHLKIKENPQDELTQMIWDFVSGADQLTDDMMVQNVIWSELQPYLNGDITSEKAAEYIQNRVSIYLAEQG